MLQWRYQRSVDSGGAALRAAIEVHFHLPWPQSKASLDHTPSSAKDEKALSRDIRAKLLCNEGSDEACSIANSIMLYICCVPSCAVATGGAAGEQPSSCRQPQAGNKESTAPTSSELFLEAAYWWPGRWGSPSISVQRVPSTIFIAAWENRKRRLAVGWWLWWGLASGSCSRIVKTDAVSVHAVTCPSQSPVMDQMLWATVTCWGKSCWITSETPTALAQQSCAVPWGGVRDVAAWSRRLCRQAFLEWHPFCHAAAAKVFVPHSTPGRHC